MRISTSVKLALFAWLVAELVTFSLVVQWIGVVDAMLLGVITSLVGFSLLRRTGSSAMAKLRAALDGGGGRLGDGRLFMDETLATIGSVALLLPGFLSDAIGLALASSVVRRTVAGALRGKVFKGRAADASAFVTPRRSGTAPRPRPSTIDLEPREWRQTETSGRPASEP